MVKFQPDNSPDNGYHSYQVYSPPDIPTTVLKQMYKDGKITKSDYKKFMKGKKVMKHNFIGDISEFAIEYRFLEELSNTELLMYVKGKNILEFSRNNKVYTTRWNIDDIVLWLRNFIDTLKDDPFPIDCEGEFAAMKDDIAREFDSDDDTFDEYYQKLYEWCLKHKWHVASNGAILADIYFQKTNDMMEISWDNRNLDEDVEFTYVVGGEYVSCNLFVDVIKTFLKEYADYWYPCN